MRKTYRAIVTATTIEWPDGPPPELGDRAAVEVVVDAGEASPVPTKPGEANGKKLAEIAAEISKLGVFDHIEDPVAWQREQRRDRPLPGRENDDDGDASSDGGRR